MRKIKIATVLGFLFAIAIAMTIIRGLRSAEEAIDVASDQASEFISSVTDGISDAESASASSADGGETAQA
jgi:hypothetical protein